MTRYVNTVGGPLSDAPREALPPERITLRLPAELTRRLDEHAARLTQEAGIHVTRSEAVRLLLEAALAEKVTLTMHSHAEWEAPRGPVSGADVVICGKREGQ